MTIGCRNRRRCVITCDRSDASSDGHAQKFVQTLRKVSRNIARTQQHCNAAKEMVLTLHVWGPAFGLPSIEPECIATIAYCQRVIPKGEWTLVAEHDPTVGVIGTYIHSPSDETGPDSTQRACRYYLTTMLQRHLGSRILSHISATTLPSQMILMQVSPVDSEPIGLRKRFRSKW